MEKTISVVFDGETFVPVEPIDLPKGTRASIVVAGEWPFTTLGKLPRVPTPEEQNRWNDILATVGTTTPEPPTLDEAMREIRGRPW